MSTTPATLSNIILNQRLHYKPYSRHPSLGSTHTQKRNDQHLAKYIEDGGGGEKRNNEGREISHFADTLHSNK